MLYRWKEWGDEREPRAWVQSLCESDTGLLSLLSAFMRRSLTWRITDVAERMEYSFDLGLLEPFIEPETLVDRVTSLALDELSDDNRRAVETFLQAIDRKAKGEPSEDV